MADIELLEGEEWRPVVGYEGQYEVSNMGRVRSLDRMINRKDGVVQHKKGQLLVLINHNAWSKNEEYGTYKVVNLNRKQKSVHALVAEAFLGERPPKYEILHLNGKRYDNRLQNLRYGTSAENKHQTYEYGGKAGPGKLSTKDVQIIRKRIKNGEGVVKLAREYGVNKSAISGIRDGKRFSWLKEGEDFAT